MTVKHVTHLGRKIDSYLLRYFLAVVEHGSITDAAETLFLAQPSLSQAVRTLERRVGAMLFDRSGQQLRLTPEGERFVPAARQVLADLASARSAVHAVRDLETGRLDITTHTAFSVDPLAELIRRFRTNHGEILVNIVAADTSVEACALVRRGDAELAIGYDGRNNSGLNTFPLPGHEIVLAAAPNLIASIPSPVPRGAVADIPLILDLRDRGTEAALRQVIATGAPPRVVVDCSHPTALWGLVSRGVGATLLPRRVAEKYVTGVNVVSLEPPLYRSPVLLARDEPLSAAATAFTALAAGLSEFPQDR